MMGCFHVSPSPAAFSVAQQPAAVAGFRQVVGRRAHCLHSPSPPRLSLRLTETRRPRLAIRAHNPVGDGDPHPANRRRRREKKPHNFPKEGRHISSLLMKLYRVFDGLLVS